MPNHHRLFHERLLYLIFLIFILISTTCTITTTKARTPVIDSLVQLNRELNDLITAERFNVEGKDVTTNGKTISELEIKVMNGQNLSTLEEVQKNLGRLLAKHVKMHLKDTGEFNIYKTSFVTNQTTNSVTKTSWISFSYSSKELTAPVLDIGKKLTSASGYTYGGSTFNKEDTEIIFLLTNFTFSDTSTISLRLRKNDGKDQENIAESHIDVNANTNYLLNRMNMQQFYDIYGPGKFQFEILTHDTIIAAKDFTVE